MKKVLLGVLLGLLLGLALLAAGVWGLVRLAGRGGVEIPDQALLVLDWSGPLPGHQVDPATAGLSGAPVTLSRVADLLREAAARPEIVGVLIDRPLELPREYLDELEAALAGFRREGKPILAHVEFGLGNGFLAACLADTLALSPAVSGGLLLPGPGVRQLYLGEALAKLGIKVHVLHQGEAKGFGEQYSQREMSPAVRENLGRLVEDLLDEELAWVGRRRDVDPARLRRELSRPDAFWLTPAQARALDLADTLLSRAAWQDLVEHRFPGAARLSLSEWAGAARGLPGPAPEGPDLDNHIAVLWAEGEIVPGKAEGALVQIGSRSLVEEIRDLAEADAVQAVVLRVESPGGSALAAEEIYQELVKLGEAKPLWVSAGPMAASGGYYLAVPGKPLWVSPFSVVGSIGVVALLPDLSEGARRLGVNPQVIHPLPAGRLASLGSPVEAATLAAVQTRMGLIYDEFRDRVRRHRGLEDARLLPLAGGRVWAGRRAAELGLADRLGGLQTCLDSLQASLGDRGLPVRHYPRQATLLDLLLSGRLRPRDLLPAGRGSAVLAEAAAQEGVLGRLAAAPARVADPRWTLRAELPIRLE